MSSLYTFRKPGMLSLVLMIAVSGTVALFQKPQDASAATSATYCGSIPKYACAQLIYSASGNNWTVLERNWKGSRGCATDQFGNWTCGAVQWRMLTGADRYVPAGGGSWNNGYAFGPYAWEYNDTLASIPWRVSGPDRTYWADAIGTYQLFQYWEQGQYWYLDVYAYA